MDMHFILQGHTARSISEVIKVTEVAEVAAPPVTKVIDMVTDVDKVTAECAKLVAMATAAAAGAKILEQENEELEVSLHPVACRACVAAPSAPHLSWGMYVCMRVCVQVYV